MAGGNGGRQRGATLRLAALLALAAPLAGCDSPLLMTPDQQLDRAIASDPSITGIYEVLEEEFPEDYAGLRATIIGAIEDGANDETAFAASQGFMIQFMARNAHLFAVAPEAELFAARDTAVRVMDMLAADDTGMCARYATTGLRHDDAPRMRTKLAMGQLTEEQIRVMAAGRDNPVERGDASEADWIAYGDAMFERGMTDPEIDDFYVGGTRLLAADQATQCRIGQAIHHAMADLPDDASARISAIMLVPVE